MNRIKELEDAITKCDVLPVGNDYLEALSELGEWLLCNRGVVMAVLRAAVEWRQEGGTTALKLLREVDRLLAGEEKA